MGLILMQGKYPDIEIADDPDFLDGFCDFIANMNLPGGTVRLAKGVGTVKFERVVAVVTGPVSDVPQSELLYCDVLFEDKEKVKTFALHRGDFDKGTPKFAGRPDNLFKEFLNGNGTPLFNYRLQRYGVVIDLRKAVWLAVRSV